MDFDNFVDFRWFLVFFDDFRWFSVVGDSFDHGRSDIGKYPHQRHPVLPNRVGMIDRDYIYSFWEPALRKYLPKTFGHSETFGRSSVVFGHLRFFGHFRPKRVFLNENGRRPLMPGGNAALGIEFDMKIKTLVNMY